MEPFYRDELATIYLADANDLLDCLAFDCVVTDPPYGISSRTKNYSGQRSAMATAKDHPPVIGDDVPFNPIRLVRFGKPTILFGANHYADRLPPSASWIVWDKLDGLTTEKRTVGFNDSADCELAWTNLKGPARIYRQRWMGCIKSGVDRRTKRRHPTEKPVELMLWCVARTEGVVLDPYMGAGSTLVAAKQIGRKSIGIELSEEYCQISADRLVSI